MAIPKAYREDFEKLLALQTAQGGTCWATPDLRIGKGSPFATLDCAIMIADLGAPRSDPVVKETAELIFKTIGPDGRCRVAPKTTIYPCHTANAVRALCWLGFAKDKRLRPSFQHFLESQSADGGWRCNAKARGASHAKDASNPGPTLWALDAFRFTDYLNTEKSLGDAVAFLLAHWVTRKPLGPCAFGIGSRFLKVEYPFLRYNLFYYVYVLSFYAQARADARFHEAFAELEAKTRTGKIVVEHRNPGLAKLTFCAKGQVSGPASKRFAEIKRNLRQS